MPIDEIDAMGTLNNTWGVCGFNSSLYALYTHNPGSRSSLAAAATIDTRIAAEMKGFLRMLQAEGNVTLLNEIEMFTRSFKGTWGAFTIADFIKKIDAEAAKYGGQHFFKMSPDLSIALPPHAVVAYLQKVAGFPGARVETEPLAGKFVTSSTANEQIVGLSKATMQSYNGLAHWVYMNNGIVYSWGLQFRGIQDLPARCNYTGVACIIALA